MSDSRESNHGVSERQIQTASGTVGYLDSGGDLPVALFVHGVATRSTLWRNAIALLGDQRRCIAVDLPLHGRTPGAPDQEFTLTAMAEFLADFCDALGLTELDLIGNDTGGAICQVFAVREAKRLRTFTLTNCDTQGNLPPKAFLPTVWLAKLHLLAPLGRMMLKKVGLARKRMFATTYEDVRHVPEDVVRGWLEPVFGQQATARRFQRWIAGMNDRELVAIEPDLRRLEVATLLVWGTGDPFFKVSHAQRLRDTIPGAGEIVEIPGGKLFFADERAAEFAPPVRRHWMAHAPLAPAS
ncbi:MAG TPA: alpha/beta hydrolase [Frankiaceae bacterium]|jgi:pimeloyl-ACP methyl ester carboxylesterase|nr:alpha/beta hydrolase [Frankiaceae bacterium]